MAELARQAWVPDHSVNIVVANGVVELQGFLTDDRQRVALRIAAENVPGVKEVRDLLRKLEPGVGG